MASKLEGQITTISEMFEKPTSVIGVLLSAIERGCENVCTEHGGIKKCFVKKLKNLQKIHKENGNGGKLPLYVFSKIVYDRASFEELEKMLKDQSKMKTI